MLFVINNIAFGQRDTIRYYPYKLVLIIKDTLAFPTGFYNDTIYIDTYSDIIDTIFKNYQVFDLHRAYPGYNPPPYTILDSVYNLSCKGNEYELLTELLNYNLANNSNIFYNVRLVPRPINNIKNNKKYEENIFAYNYQNKTLEFRNLTNEEIYVEIYNIKGQLIRIIQKNNNKFYSIDIADIQNGIYFINIIINGETIKPFKLIKL
jgi:gamma-glutamylcyclotransferase (GGCT)/AIG2-like uncharacterized protein YtfP